VLGAVAFTSILFAAVQLLPSLEYAPLAYRWVGGEAPIRPLEKIPYSLLVPWSFGPQSLFGFVLGEVDAGRSDWTPYFGVLPLVLVIIGVWKYWSNPLIRYLSVLAALAFVYSWGSLSFLHGVLYLVPYLDIAREADRFIYLTHFAMAILAGFGVQYLFKDRKPGEGFSLSPLISVLKWVTAGFAALLAAASLGLPVGVTEKTYLSFFFIAAALALLLFLRGGRTAQGVSFVLVFLIVWDLYAFNRMIQSKVERRKVNGDALAHLVYDRKLADFVKSQPGMPRVHFDIPEGAPNIGNAYGVPVTWAMSASMLMDYTAGIGYGRQRDLLSVKYTIRHRDEKSGNTPVYRDDMWDVFENPNALPRAWIVHRADVDSSTERPLQQVIDPSFDLTRTVILDRPLESPLVNDVVGTGNTVKWLTYQPNRLELEVHAEAAGVLVLSEVYYPGWTASVDGERAEIYRANGLLRAIPIQEGTHRVVVRYLPNSVRWGAALTVLTFLGVCILLRLANKS
jgi:hypothetical protein